MAEIKAVGRDRKGNFEGAGDALYPDLGDGYKRIHTETFLEVQFNILFALSYIYTSITRYKNKAGFLLKSHL